LSISKLSDRPTLELSVKIPSKFSSNELRATWVKRLKNISQYLQNLRIDKKDNKCSMGNRKRIGDKPDGMASLTASQEGTGKTDNLHCLY
jgi:predicted metal-dependent hydrolase